MVAEIEDAEFELAEAMSLYSLQQLHSELISRNELNRYVAARQLQVRGSAITFTYVKSLVESNCAPLREIAAFTLGQLGTPMRPFLQQSLPILRMLLTDPESGVRAAAATALGHLAALESVSCLAAAITDDCAVVRSGVAFALGQLNHEKALSPLLALTHDSDQEVRCWAVLGVVALNAPSDAVRARFRELLNDPSPEIRDEVICGLAMWRDEYAFYALLNALHGEEINLDLLDAAGNLADVRILPRLKELADEWVSDPPSKLATIIHKIELNL